MKVPRSTFELLVRTRSDPSIVERAFIALWNYGIDSVSFWVVYPKSVRAIRDMKQANQMTRSRFELAMENVDCFDLTDAIDAHVGAHVEQVVIFALAAKPPRFHRDPSR